MNSRIRPAQESDLFEGTRVFVDTVFDLARRCGLALPPVTVEDRLPFYRHILETGQFLVTEVDGKIAAIANSILRDDIWFLSGFWTRPEFQGKGLGRPMLEQLWASVKAQGAKRAFTWSSIDYAAIHSYLALGMVPQCQIFTFAGVPQTHLSNGPGSTPQVPLPLNTAMAIDLKVRGCSRKLDHEFLARQSDARAFQALSGYFYVQKGFVGPAAWLDPADGPRILDLAVAEALRDSKEIRFTLPVLNTVALEVAKKLRLRIMSTSHLMWNEPIGQMQNYLPSGPLLF